MELGIQSDSILLLVCYRLVLTKTRLRWKSGNTLLDDLGYEQKGDVWPVK